MKELSITQKILIAAGTVAVTAAAVVGTVAVIKKLNEKNENIAVLEFNGDEVNAEEKDEEDTKETTEE